MIRRHPPISIHCFLAVFLATFILLALAVVNSSAAVTQGYILQPLMYPVSPRSRSRGNRRYRRQPTRAMSVEEYQSHFLDDDKWMTDKNIRIWDTKIGSRRPNDYSWTSKLIFANIFGYALQVIRPRITELGVKLSETILSGQELYRLITPVFLHGSPYHLFTNMYSLNNIGQMTEKLFGPGRYLAMYLVSGATGNLLSSFQSPNPALGASGAVFGVMGALYVFLNRNGWVMGEQGEAYSSAITQTLIINMVLGYINPMVDNWGHLGGAIGGAAMSYYFGPRLLIAKLPNDGGQVIVDKPILRLPMTLENIPRNLSNGVSRIVRRMHIWRVKNGLPGKPWQSKQLRRSDYRGRKHAPNKSIKPNLDNF